MRTPDRPLHNGFMVHTYETRGALKKLLPTCKQPSAQELAADAFAKKQQEIYAANVAKANPQANSQLGPAANASGGQAGGGGMPVGGEGIQTTGTNLLKSVFSGGDTGPPTPGGIRMHGIFAASTGFSAQFFPESVVLGCGPDAARAYPYTVTARVGEAR